MAAHPRPTRFIHYGLQRQTMSGMGFSLYPPALQPGRCSSQSRIRAGFRHMFLHHIVRSLLQREPTIGTSWPLRLTHMIDRRSTLGHPVAPPSTAARERSFVGNRGSWTPSMPGTKWSRRNSVKSWRRMSSKLFNEVESSRMFPKANPIRVA